MTDWMHDNYWIDELIKILRERGPIQTVRVSSAQAKGRAKQYTYWGVVPYELTLTKHGRPHHRALGRASSERRSLRLAFQDGQRLARQTGRVFVGRLHSGRLSNMDCSNAIDILEQGDKAYVLRIQLE